jgi:multidrug efflux system outer membrane protein
MKSYIIPVLLALTLASCNVSRQYERPAVNTSTDLYRDYGHPADSASIASMPLEKLFTDSILQRLIREGLNQNIDIQIAYQRIVAAQANFQQNRVAFLPDLNGNASIKQSKLAYPQGFGIISSSTQYDVGLTASWEVDIWGKLRSAKRAALANLLQTKEARSAIQAQLIASIAGNYFNLLALDQQLLVLEQTVINRKTDVRTMKALKAANIVNGAAEVQSEASQYAAEVTIPKIQKQIRETENALCNLLAKPSAAVKRASLNEQQLPVNLKAGLPVQLLQRRPDVKQAEFAFMAAFENTNVARRLFYPPLTLTASGGFTSFSLKDWITPDGLFGNIAAGIAQPIFNKGANKARLVTAKAAQQEAALNFQKTLLNAGAEVSNALFAYQTATRQQEIRIKQLASLEKSVDFTKKLLRYSSATNYTDVLTSEQNLLAAQLEDIDDKLQQWQAVIALYRALGNVEN